MNWQEVVQLVFSFLLVIHLYFPKDWCKSLETPSLKSVNMLHHCFLKSTVHPVLSTRLIGHEHGGFGLWLFLRAINKGNNSLLHSPLLCVNTKKQKKTNVYNAYAYISVGGWKADDAADLICET